MTSRLANLQRQSPLSYSLYYSFELRVRLRKSFLIPLAVYLRTVLLPIPFFCCSALPLVFEASPFFLVTFPSLVLPVLLSPLFGPSDPLLPLLFNTQYRYFLKFLSSTSSSDLCPLQKILHESAVNFPQPENSEGDNQSLAKKSFDMLRKALILFICSPRGLIASIRTSSVGASTAVGDGQQEMKLLIVARIRGPPVVLLHNIQHTKCSQGSWNCSCPRSRGDLGAAVRFIRWLQYASQPPFGTRCAARVSTAGPHLATARDFQRESS